MVITEVLGQSHLKEQLFLSANNGRIPHAQIFVGPEGSGTLAMAINYAKHLICGEFTNAACSTKFNQLTHPDLHFIYPTTTNNEIKKNPKSVDFIGLWRQFVLSNPYAGLQTWFKFLKVENKQGFIRVEDAIEIQKAFSLKSFEGGYKVLIIWMAEKMNIETSNKLLKMVEEPPDKTVIIFVVENEKELLQTILSRCQLTRFHKIEHQLLVKKLIETYFLDDYSADVVASRAQGNYGKALELLEPDSDEHLFESTVIDWVRLAFAAKTNPSKIIDLIKWSEKIAQWGRETQKTFLDFCLEFFRQALLLNYQANELVYFKAFSEQFDLQKFAPFINGANISEIYKVISEAAYHIERNGNPKLIFSDMSIKLTRLIHKK